MTDTRQARRALIQKLAADLSDAMQVREGSWTGWNKPIKVAYAEALAQRLIDKGWRHLP